jgi:hypothetical protein
VRLWIQFSVNASGVVDAGWSCQRQLFRHPLSEFYRVTVTASVVDVIPWNTAVPSVEPLKKRSDTTKSHEAA